MRADACRDPRDGFPIERSSGATVTASAMHECDDARSRNKWAGSAGEPMTTNALRSWNEELSAVHPIDQLSRLTLNEAKANVAVIEKSLSRHADNANFFLNNNYANLCLLYTDILLQKY